MPKLWLHLAVYNEAMGLEKIVKISIRVAHNMQGCMEHQQGQFFSSPHQPEYVGSPEGACYQSLPHSSSPSSGEFSPLTYIVCLTASDISISINALIDSGSARNFISGKLCDHLKLKKKCTEVCYKIHSITGKPLRFSKPGKSSPLCWTSTTASRSPSCREHRTPGSGEFHRRQCPWTPLAHPT